MNAELLYGSWGKMRKNIIVVLAIIGILVFVNQMSKTSIAKQYEGLDYFSCFDYQDNDNDGLYDLNDNDCFGLGMSDSDGDGILDIDEYESGTNIMEGD